MPCDASLFCELPLVGLLLNVVERHCFAPSTIIELDCLHCNLGVSKHANNQWVESAEWLVDAVDNT